MPIPQLRILVAEYLKIVSSDEGMIPIVGYYLNCLMRLFHSFVTDAEIARHHIMSKVLSAS